MPTTVQARFFIVGADVSRYNQNANSERAGTVGWKRRSPAQPAKKKKFLLQACETEKGRFLTYSAEQPADGAQPDPQGVAYEKLRSLAKSYLRGQRVGHTLQPTALVHEAYARLLHAERIYGVDTGAFVVMAAKAMRSVLIDHARKRGRIKRGGAARREPLDDVVDLYEAQAINLISLDEAMSKLGEVDPQLVRVIELRFFGGLSENDTGEMLGVSSRTVGRLWRRARAWLRSEMGEDNEA